MSKCTAKTNIKKESSNYLYLLPLTVILAIVPLVVRLKILLVDESIRAYWIDKYNNDFFSYYKANLLIFFSVIALLFLCSKLLLKETTVKKSFIYIPVAIYSAAVIISSIFSKYKSVALRGFPDRYEGMWVLLSYIVILVITINLVDNTKQATFLFRALIISSSVIGVIGSFQYFGFDFFATPFGKSIIVPASYKEFLGDVGFTLGSYTIYSTLFNSNYVGTYMAMLFPISIVLFLVEDSPRHKLFYGIFTCIMFINWVGSRSRGGWIAGLIALFFVVLLLRNIIIKNLRYIIPIAITFSLIFVGMNYVSDDYLAGKISLEKTQGQATDMKTVDLIINPKEIIFDDQAVLLKILKVQDELVIMDENGQELSYRNIGEDGKVTLVLDHPRYNEYKILFSDNLLAFSIQRDEYYVSFALTDSGFRLFDFQGVMVNNNIKVESFGFEGLEHIGSGRGYIWSRSIPIIKRTLLFGFGPDTYAMYFPQNDLVGKARFLGAPRTIVDKPHNIYLQIAINTGLLSLFSLLTIWAYYFYTSIKAYWEVETINKTVTFGICSFAAFIGYAVIGIFNDSVVSVAPVFWILLGIGMSLNQKVLKDL